MPWDQDIILFTAFGLVVVVPIVAILAAHKRRMAELDHKIHELQLSDEMFFRLDVMQCQMDDMRDRQNEILLKVHDLHQVPSPKVEDRIQE